AQTEQVTGLHENIPGIHAFTNATIYVTPSRVLNNATLVIRNGSIEAVGRNVTPPADARIWNLEGKTIYPGFIDPHTSVGMNDPREELDRGALSWNPQIRSQLTAFKEYKTEKDGAGDLRNQGFTSAVSVPPLGIFRGQPAVMSLGNGPVSDRVIKPDVAQSVTLRNNRDFGFVYPTSPIGAIALIRQTLLDADWYQRAHNVYNSNPGGLNRPESNAALEALIQAVNREQPLYFETVNEEEYQRALRIADEFNITTWIRGSGHEYKILELISRSEIPLVLPLAFPEKPKVKTPEEALNRSLSELRHWYLAPENPSRIAAAGKSFSFTTDGLDDLKDFLPNLRKAVQLGLDSETALAALTTNPASMLGISNTHGTLERGKAANFIIADGNLFDTKSKILDVWVDGERFRINHAPDVDPRGEWQIVSSDGSVDGVLQIKGKPEKLNGSITIDNKEIDLKTVSFRDQSRRFRADFPGDTLGIEGPVRISASLSIAGEELHGWAEIFDRGQTEWSAVRTSAAEPDSDKNEIKTTGRDLSLTDIRPAMEYGREAIPDQPEILLIRNTTIWTMGSDGILQNADLLIRRGEIVEVGHNIRAPRNAQIVDAAGKHVTPGLIDAHLHSGTDGVNEVGNAIVPEVRLGDVLNINNIWMYRQLAGGLTTAHVMHGSANPIGGQNQHIKMRWGSLSDELKFEGAPRTVKFALGENVKRVGTDRYPETRMGTQQIIADHFRAARDYQARWNEWERSGQGIPPRRDLRMEALVDILEEDILIQSHSYRQDEILMLARLAEEFDIKVKAFHHGVEAYKVAPELAEMGVGAVIWSDWSSFKIEAYDATNFNARLLHEAGVLTSLHSDNSQIAARMNWEAAKMVRTGMDPEDALALVTINTAKILGIDEWVGSLEAGKDADFVIWSGDPLSTFTKAEQTWVDGRKQFDLEEDKRMRKMIEEERTKLISLILNED
ncbi:MAG: amidohydrolase family protein, partial [Balneolaceae bacterium]